MREADETRFAFPPAGGSATKHEAHVAAAVSTSYDELHRLAAACFQREPSDHTLQPTAVVHEVFLRLLRQRSIGWNDRTSFFAAAARTMRRVLVDHARLRSTLRRGETAAREPLGDDLVDPAHAVETAGTHGGADLLALDEALERLARYDERKARLVELRTFAGLSLPQISATLDVPLRTLEREWAFTKAWLRSQVEEA